MTNYAQIIRVFTNKGKGGNRSCIIYATIKNIHSAPSSGFRIWLIYLKILVKKSHDIIISYLTIQKSRARFFTPAGKINFCGHRLLVAAFYCHQNSFSFPLMFQTNVGNVCICLMIDALQVTCFGFKLQTGKI